MTSNRIIALGIAILLECFAHSSLAQNPTPFISSKLVGGVGVPTMGIYCMDSFGFAQICSFGSGGGGGGSGGTVTQGPAGTSAWPVSLAALPPLSAGAASIGSVSVSNFPSMQAVSLSALPALSAGSAAIGSVTVSNLPSTQAVSIAALPSLSAGTAAIGSVSVTNLPATQGVAEATLDGTIAAGAVQVTSDSAAVSGTISVQNANPSSGTATPGSAVAMTVNGQATLVVGVQGTYTGSLSVQGTMDGTNWITSAVSVGVRSWASSGASASIPAASTGIFEVDVTGLSQVRVTALSAITGSATVVLRLGSRQHGVYLDTKSPVTITGYSGGSMDSLASGGASAGQSMQIGGQYASTPSALTSGQSAELVVNTARGLYVDPEGLKATYSAAASVTLATAATDAFQLCGVASKELRIRQISLQGVATTAGGMQVQLIKRSTADSGGTSGAITSVANDVNNAASGASVLSFTANPTAGTPIGTLQAFYVPFPLAANETTPAIVTFGAPRGDQAVTLRSASDCVAVNLGGATVPAGAALTASFEYTLN